MDLGTSYKPITICDVGGSFPLCRNGGRACCSFFTPSVIVEELRWGGVTFSDFFSSACLCLPALLPFPPVAGLWFFPRPLRVRSFFPNSIFNSNNKSQLRIQDWKEPLPHSFRICLYSSLLLPLFACFICCEPCFRISTKYGKSSNSGSRASSPRSLDSPRPRSSDTPNITNESPPSH